MNRKVDQTLSGGVKTGDIIKYFEEMDDILERNSGVNDNKTLTSDASDPPCPIENNTYTKLKITDDAIHITNIDKSSITAEVQLMINFPSDFWTELLNRDESNSEPSNSAAKVSRGYRNLITKWFVGLKSSIHMFDAYRIYSYNKKTNCEQTEALYENTAIRMLKPQEELDQKPHIYTTWRHAVCGDDCVCGTYFTLQDILDKGSRTGLQVEFEICVPLDDFLPLSGFTMYPNKVFENLSLELKMGIQQNLVVCQVDPLEEFRRLMKIRGEPSAALAAMYSTLQADVPAYSRHFTQMNDKFKSVIYTIADNNTLTANIETISFTCTKGKFLNLRSHINGFNIKDSVLQELRRKYSEKPLIIPAQYCDYQAFSQKPMATSLKCNTTYGMTNVSSLIFIFPRTHNEITVCQNPHLSSIQLQIDNKPFPDKPFSTLEAAHSIFNLTNAGLDSLFSPSEEFSYSMNFRELQSVPAVESDKEVTVVAPYKDNTSYCFVCSTERLSGYGNFCDGLTKDNAHITLTATLEGDPSHNPYYTNPITKESGNDRSPIMIVCQDCFWVLRTDQTAEFVNNNKYFYEEETEGETQTRKYRF